MQKLFRSFAAGVGSVLSIYPQCKAESRHVEIVEAIGGDFSKVGGDLSRAIEIKARDVHGTAVKTEEFDGEGQAEQLELIP